jgi:hypothetical protein
MHDRAHVGEVHVHETGDADQRRDPLRRMEQNLIGLLERVLERDPLPDDGEQPLVRDDDHRVDVLAHLGDAQLGLTHALAPLEEERLRHDADAQRARFARELADDRGGAGPGAAAHAARDEDEIGLREGVQHLVAALLDRLTPDLGARAGAESARQLLANLDLHVGLRTEQRLRIGVHGDELDAFEPLLDHPIDRVSTTAADAHHLHAGARRCALLELEDHCE